MQKKEYTFQIVERCRDLHESKKAFGPLKIQREIRKEIGLRIPRDTINDWIHFRTRGRA